MTSLVAFFCSEFLSRDGGRRVSAQWVIVEEGFCVPRELSTYLTHVGDDGAKISKRYVRMCRCCGDVWDCSQSLDFWASPAATRGCCSCPTHVNCVCNVTRWNKGKKQGRKERNRPKFAHKTAPTPISNAPEAFSSSDILNTTEMGRDTESCSGATGCDEKWKQQSEFFFWPTLCMGSVCPSVFLHMEPGTCKLRMLRVTFVGDFPQKWKKRGISH